MNKRNNIFAGCSVVVALGAVGVGALVSSNAMAASEDPADTAVTIGMITVADDGSAFECTFDATEFPGFLPMDVTGTDAPALPGGGTFADGQLVTAVDGAVTSSGSIVMDGGAPADLGDLEASGTASVLAAPGEGAGVFQVVTDGEVQPIEVRQGTDSECAEATANTQP